MQPNCTASPPSHHPSYLPTLPSERELLGGQCFGSEGAERDAWEGRRRAVSPYANRAGKAFLAKIVDFSVSRAMQGSATHHPRDHGETHAPLRWLQPCIMTHAYMRDP